MLAAPSNPYSPLPRYNQLDVLAAAHRKHGSLQAIQAGAARARATADKKKAMLAGGEEERRWVYGQESRGCRRGWEKAMLAWVEEECR